MNSEKSAESVAGALSVLLSHLISEIVDGGKVDHKELELPFPVSRADSQDLSKLLGIWQSRDMEPISSLPARMCPGCGGNQSTFIFHSYDGYPYNVCTECETWFIPFVVDEYIDNFLAKYEDGQRIVESIMGSRVEQTRDADLKRFQYYLEIPAQVLKSSKGEEAKYLDIGCGVGHSLELAATLGLKASGVEVDKTALRICTESGNQVFLPAELEFVENFDVVSLFEALEHIVDPQKLLQDVYKLLNPGGLVLITVPNVASWDISLLKQNSAHVYGGIDGVGHINLWSPRSLKRLLEQSGFSVLFEDGQYGSNPFETVKSISDAHLAPQSPLDAQSRTTVIPTYLYSLINPIGPYLTALDRLTGRAPISFVVGCRQEDRFGLEPIAKLFKDRRRSELKNEGLIK